MIEHFILETYLIIVIVLLFVLILKIISLLDKYRLKYGFDRTLEATRFNKRLQRNIPKLNKRLDDIERIFKRRNKLN